MIHIQEGTVTHVLEESEQIQIIEVEHEQTTEKGINYPFLTGVVKEGDRVLINTTAVDLDLGTGGYHFVLYRFKENDTEGSTTGHIMKLNYTPLQFATRTCEEQTSPFHELLNRTSSIEGMPVMIGGLHSMLPISVTYLKYQFSGIRIAYIMTDKAALPIALSNHVRVLKKLRWLEATITIGQAFGGDLEAVNIYTALLAAKHIVKADLAIILMGPGLIGTGTKLGFSGMEQVENVHAVHSLGGVPILIPRLSQKDERKRHQGISHHTQSVLSHLLVPVHLPLLESAVEEQDANNLLQKQLLHLFKQPHHHLSDILANYPVSIHTMGRSIDQDPLFFQSVAIAAEYAIRFIST
jgi:hypothetical protein